MYGGFSTFPKHYTSSLFSFLNQLLKRLTHRLLFRETEPGIRGPRRFAFAVELYRIFLEISLPALPDPDQLTQRAARQYQTCSPSSAPRKLRTFSLHDLL